MVYSLHSSQSDFSENVDHIVSLHGLNLSIASDSIQNLKSSSLPWSRRPCVWFLLMFQAHHMFSQWHPFLDLGFLYVLVFPSEMLFPRSHPSGISLNLSSLGTPSLISLHLLPWRLPPFHGDCSPPPPPFSHQDSSRFSSQHLVLILLLIHSSSGPIASTESCPRCWRHRLEQPRRLLLSQPTAPQDRNGVCSCCPQTWHREEVQ